MSGLDALVPMLHVQSVPRAIRFYRHLGFVVGNTFVPPGSSEPSWAWLESGGARLMVTRADLPVDPEQQAVIFYLYSEDVAGLRARLQGEGLAVGALQYPFHSPGGEFRLSDPDGYALMVRHA